MNRSIQPRNYSRITAFTVVEYREDIQKRIDKYVPKWYNKTDNGKVDENKTF